MAKTITISQTKIICEWDRRHDARPSTNKTAKWGGVARKPESRNGRARKRNRSFFYL